ncbi:gluconate 2-dehydrogenase subunit 3 family protein [Luteimonas saliphila]|uniref:gluconate 2-dehydrogenase subunit 3 family protein n=1 Tax=Luteimonas saliphila TaxID=2804919 RepID=UPI00192DAD0B|nr:gluconate 2-dehydrogenase subunit 3 family protein [Luteimonas saliphila]
MDRRELLKMIASATGVAMVGVPAFVLGQAPVPQAGADFTAEDIALLDEIAEAIIPRTDTPGAKDAEVGAFMARFVTDCYTPEDQAAFRAGLADLDRRADGSFMALPPAARLQMLTALDREAVEQARRAWVAADGSGSGSGVHPFTMIKQLVLFSFFTSKVGATEVLRYDPVPGGYDGDLPYEPGTPAWATR